METQPSTAGLPRPWRRLLSGAALQAALEIVEQIARDARHAIERYADEASDPGGLNSCSLSCGRAGAALFYAQRAACVSGVEDDHASELLESAIEILGEKSPTPSLFCGFTGVAWVMEHLNRMVEARMREAGAASSESKFLSDDPNSDVDELLVSLLDEAGDDAEYDLIDGMSGVGAYALERLPIASGRMILERIIDRLAALARPQPIGLAWPTPRHRAGSRLRRDARLNADFVEFNLGLSHGVPGVVALLARSVAAGVAVDRSAELLRGAVPWLLSQRLPEHESGCYSDFVIEGIDSRPTRCAWCYGDAGVAAALLAAADALDDADWRAAALEVARKAAAQRDIVRDAGLCHGAAGLGHAFNRLYQATGDDALRRAALDWFEWTLGFHRPGEGLAGFRTWSVERKFEGEWIEDPRFLTGVPGIGLALLAAASDVTPAWDRVMMLDVTPRPPAI